MFPSFLFQHFFYWTELIEKKESVCVTFHAIYRILRKNMKLMFPHRLLLGLYGLELS